MLLPPFLPPSERAAAEKKQIPSAVHPVNQQVEAEPNPKPTIEYDSTLPSIEEFVLGERYEGSGFDSSPLPVEIPEWVDQSAIVVDGQELVQLGGLTRSDPAEVAVDTAPEVVEQADGGGAEPLIRAPESSVAAKSKQEEEEPSISQEAEQISGGDESWPVPTQVVATASMPEVSEPLPSSSDSILIEVEEETEKSPDDGESAEPVSEEIDEDDWYQDLGRDFEHSFEGLSSAVLNQNEEATEEDLESTLENWLTQERDSFDWSSMADLAYRSSRMSVGTDEEAEKAEAEWSSTDWNSPASASNSQLASMLIQLAKRVKSGELEVEARGTTTEAALASLLSALLSSPRTDTKD